MKILVDADACPNMVKEILFRAAIRTKIKVILFSNHAISTPASPYISKIQVVAGFDVADNRIIQNLEAGDLVVTADIPLAHAVINENGLALNPRGDLYTKANIKERLSLRNFSDSLRSSGLKVGGPPTLNKNQIQRFANALNLILQK